MKSHTIIVLGSLLILLLAAAAPVSATTTSISGDSITTVSPNAGMRGTTSLTLTLTGVNFTTTQGSVWLEKDDSEISATISSWSANTIVCKIKITSSRDTGDWDVVVQKGYDNTKIVKSDGFTVTKAMSISSISPATARADGDVDYTLTGENLDDVEKVYLYNKNYDNITDSDPDVDSSTKVKGTFDLSDADEATYDVCVMDSHKAIKCDLSFRITTNKMGSIDVSSSPSGASIFLDGMANGTTPATLDDVTVGSHKIVLRKSGYEEWGKTVSVTEDDTTEVDAKLYAQSAATQQTTSPTPVQTTAPRTTRTTVKSTLKIPTTYSVAPTTATTSSPLDPALILGAVCLGFIVIRKH